MNENPAADDEAEGLRDEALDRKGGRIYGCSVCAASREPSTD